MAAKENKICDSNEMTEESQDSSDLSDLPQTKQELMEKLAAQSSPISLEELTEILGSTIRHDDTTKNLTLLAMLLTYTEEDQINIGFLAESSTGKSYIPLQLAALFPEEDVIKLGFASPQAFYYETGVLIPDPSDKRDIEEEKRRKIRVVDLQKKILIFLDQPHDQLLQRLRSLLSHDEKQIVSKFVNRKEKSGNRTETVIIKGYPTVLFCTAKFTMQDQEKTRLLLLSPEICQEKLKETVALRIQKESDREEYKKQVDENQKRIKLQTRIWAIKRSGITHVKIPLEYREKIYQRFMDDHKKLIPRNQRDISRLLAIMKGHALLNFAYRQHIENCIFVNEEDIITGFKLYYEISQANEIGIPPEIFNIYQKLKPTFETKENGITRKDFQAWYFQTFYKIIGRERATEILKIFDTTGLLIEQTDPLDKRFARYVLPDMGVNGKDSSDSEKNNVYLTWGLKTRM